jgi:hypothetical protein
MSHPLHFTPSFLQENRKAGREDMGSEKNLEQIRMIFWIFLHAKTDLAARGRKFVTLITLEQKIAQLKPHFIPWPK